MYGWKLQKMLLLKPVHPGNTAKLNSSETGKMKVATVLLLSASNRLRSRQHVFLRQMAGKIGRDPNED